MTEKELVAKMLETLVKSRKELANIDLGITKKSLPDLDKIIEHISAPLMIMVMGEFSTGKSTFINAMVGEEVAAVNATPTTAVITKLCYGAKDKILVHFTDGMEKEVEKASFKQLTAKTGKENEEKTHESIEYVERHLPLDMLQYVTIIDSPGLNDINEKHSDTTKKFVNNADTVFWMFNALHAGSKTEVDAMEALTPRLKPIAIINMMDEIDEEEDEPQEFLDNLRLQLKDKVQAVVGISAKYALEGKLERNETKTEIGNLKEVEQVVKELVLPNRDRFKLNTLMDELGNWLANIATDIKSEEEKNQINKENDYDSYLENKAKLQQNEEVLFYIAKVIKDYCTEECASFNEQAMFFAGVLFFWGICVKNDNEKAEMYWERAALKNHVLTQRLLGVLYSEKEDFKKAIYWYIKAAEHGDVEIQGLLAGVFKGDVKAQTSLMAICEGRGNEQDFKQLIYQYTIIFEQNQKSVIPLSKSTCEINETIKNNESEFDILRNRAEQGDADAQAYLGDCYYDGEKIGQDYQQAEYWYKKAAEQGHKNAQVNLGKYYYEGKGAEQDYQQAIYWFRKSAEQGEAIAQFWLGDCYYNGNGVTQDYQQAVYWYKKAAEQGNVNAQSMLGLIYYEGKGVAEDYQQSFRWYRQAAEQGNADAQCMLSFYYSLGEGGVAEDIQQSIHWCRKAAEQGNIDAQGSLGFYYYYGYVDGLPEDYQQAVHWLTKAAEQGDADSQNYLGNCYYNGYGVTQDYRQAVHWYKKAVEQGHKNAQVNLGKYYYEGKGAEQDYQQAIYWFRKSAEQGEAIAEIWLGDCYYNGNGVSQDYQQAVYWYQKAAEHGYKVAYERLNSINSSDNSNNNNNNNNKSGCFITTAVCNSSNKKDDCYELQMFRRFRDNWLLKQIDGEKIIADYYRIAPNIVNEIDKCPDSKIIYNNIWNNYLRKCLSMIENNENEKCKQLYTMMVQRLKQNYYND